MRFSYQGAISEPPDGGGYQLVYRPEIPITVIGPAGSDEYLGLVDTGADSTVLPKTIADFLGIILKPTFGPPARGFGGQRLKLFSGELIFQIEADGEIIRWPTPVYFLDSGDETEDTIVLGHSGFLDYFTATFDGREAMLSLVANEDLPVA